MENETLNRRRTDYLSWTDYFMGAALLASKRSKDPCTQVGACIVDDQNVILSVGYNGMPHGCSDDEFSWAKPAHNELDNKYLYVCHAEMNALFNLNGQSAKGCTLYTTLFPCNECAKLVIQAKIKSVYYLSDKHAAKITTVASKKMLKSAKIEFRRHIPERKQIVLDFSVDDPDCSDYSGMERRQFEADSSTEEAGIVRHLCDNNSRDAASPSKREIASSMDRLQIR